MISPLADTLIWTVAFAVALVLSVIALRGSIQLEHVAKTVGASARALMRGQRRANTVRVGISALGLLVGCISLVNLQWRSVLPADLTSAVVVSSLLGIAVLVSLHAFTDLYSDRQLTKALKREVNLDEH